MDSESKEELEDIGPPPTTRSQRSGKAFAPAFAIATPYAIQHEDDEGTPRPRSHSRVELTLESLSTSPGKKSQSQILNLTTVPLANPASLMETIGTMEATARHKKARGRPNEIALSFTGQMGFAFARLARYSDYIVAHFFTVLPLLLLLPSLFGFI